MAITSNGTKVSFNNTPQAKDDVFANAALTEDSVSVFVFDVMANDAGGNAKTLYAVDAGGDQNRLLAKDAARTEADSTDISALGAKVWITADGKIAYHLTDAVSSQLQSLGSGEFLTDSFTYAIQLGNGTLSWATATVRVEGGNDAVIVSAADLAGAATEMASPAGTLADNGVIAFSDADKHDTHLVSAAAIGTNLGSLTAVLDSDTTGTGAGGHVTWTYGVDANAVEYLAAGETKVESFTVTIDDLHGGAAARQVDVTLTGTNDGPLVTAAKLDGAVTELAAPAGVLSDNGTISFSDADLKDVHIVSAAAQGATLGTLAAVAHSDTTGTGTGGTIDWTYQVSADAIEYLGEGVTKVESFTVTLDDQHGGVVTKQVDVTLTGTNDVAIITGTDAGAVTEDANVVAGKLTTGGTLAIADADAGESFFTAQDNVRGSGGYGTFSLDANGAWTYAANNGNAAIQALNAGQSLTDSFTAVSLDGSSSQLVSVTINGANEPVTAKGFESGTLSGWSSIGSVSVTTQNNGYAAVEGHYFALLNANGANASQIETFLGVNSGSLSALGNGNPTSGSALKTQLQVHTGDVVHFDWAFKATDYLPFNDFAVAVVGNGQLLELSDIQAVGDFGTTGWKSFNYTATSDMVMVIGVATSNVLDTAGSPQLMIDNLRIM